MDWSKLDAPLAAAVGDNDDDVESFSVFVTVTRPPTATERNVVSSLDKAPSDPSTFTAALSADELDRLSEQQWVGSLELSQVLRPLHRA